jgi:hypothetical protein
VFDFLALDRTGIIYDLPSDRLKHSDGMPLLELDTREFLKDAFVHVQSPAQLAAGIARALAPTAEMRAAAARDRAMLFHQLDGRASERLKATIEALLQEGGHEHGA